MQTRRLVSEDAWYDKIWHDSAVLTQDVAIEIKFRLNTHFNFGPEDAVDLQAVEPLVMPTLSLATELWLTTVEAEFQILQLIRYYADVFRLIKIHKKSLANKRHYFRLGLFISNPDQTFNLQFGYFDTLSRMKKVLEALSHPPQIGEVYFERNQCEAIEIDARDGMLFIRESDPDYQDYSVVAKVPLFGLASSSTAEWARALKIVASLTEALSIDAWTG